jgi:pimeloyl-ACP methyl ester carboxylesterase
VSSFRKARKVDFRFKVDGPLPPVMILPGILSSDRATSFMRRTFSASGFPTYASELGFVTGVTPERLRKAEQRLAEIAAQHGEPAVLVGWSLGGIYARVLAQRRPEHVRMVVTLGTPFSGNRRANNAWRLYNALNDHTVDAPVVPDDPAAKPPVHTVAVWSIDDGVVAPTSARGKSGERDVATLFGNRHFAYGSQRNAVEEVVQLVASELAMRCPEPTAEV